MTDDLVYTSGMVLFELLENSGLLKKGAVNSSHIATSSVDDLLELSKQSAQITSVTNAPSATTTFTHSATLPLSGWPTPCVSVKCRVNNVRNLGQFAALYSDRVYVPNFLASHADHWDPNEQGSAELRENIKNDVEVLVAVRPLIENGHIIPVSPQSGVCARCFNAYESSRPEVEKSDRARRELEKAFFESTTIEVFRGRDGYELKYSGPEEIFEHDFYGDLSKEIVEQLKRMPRLHRRILEGKRIVASKTLRNQIGLHKQLAFNVLRDARFELAMSKVLGTSYLADNVMQMRAINAMLGSQAVEERNTMMYNHLTTMVPFLIDIQPEDLLKMRRREEEAFILFRQALTQAIEEVRQQQGVFTEQHAKALYSDVLEPKLAVLERQMKKGTRDLRRFTIGFTGSWAAAISFGMLSGLLPFNLASIAAAFGIATVQKTTETALMRAGQDETMIQEDDMYFLWKVRRLAQ